MSTKLHHFTTVYVVCLAIRVALGPRLPSLTCSKLCKCEVDKNHRVKAKCNFEGIDSSTLSNIQWPQHLFSLDLSSSNLKKLPASFTRKLSNISILNLANNSLEDMTTESFGELKELRALDLSYSKFWRWQFLTNELSKLETLYVKGVDLYDTYFWSHILSLPSIKTVRDVKWLNACNQCNITKTLKLNIMFLANKTRLFYSKGNTSAGSSGDMCRYTYFLLTGRDILEHVKQGFALECWCDLQHCATNVAKILEILSRFALTLRLVQRLFNSLYPLASVALMFNSIVISFILTSKDLRKSPTMLLILNMAVCDVFMTIWCIFTCRYNKFLDSEEGVKTFNFSIWTESTTSIEKYCPYMTFIYGVTQLVTVATSIFLVVEKYLVIVYSMRPGVRLTKRIAILSTAITWCVAIVYFVYAVFLVDRDDKLKQLEQNFFLCATSGRLTKLIPDLPMSILISWIGFFLICCTIPLYIHIYIVVKKSSNQMGIKREGTLAKRLAVLIFTNLLCSTVPMSIMPFASSQLRTWQWAIFFFLPGPDLMKIFLISCVWTPVLLLCLNSCLNPYLFAFRNRLFQRNFTTTVRKVLQRLQNNSAQNTDQQVRQQRRRNRVMAEDGNVRETSL